MIVSYKEMVEASKKVSTIYLEEFCKKNANFINYIKILDEYDFSEFLTYGRDFSNMIEAIEEKYDKDCFEKYGIYLFDNLTTDEIQHYFISRYNIWFQEYSAWVVRYEDGPNSKARKRA